MPIVMPITYGYLEFINNKSKSYQITSLGHTILGVMTAPFDISLETKKLASNMNCSLNNKINIKAKTFNFIKDTEFDNTFNYIVKELNKTCSSINAHALNSLNRLLKTKQGFKIRYLTTINNDTKQVCVWKSCKTKGYWALMLHSVDNMTLNSGLDSAIANQAAGYMMNDICSLKPTDKKQYVCEFK